MTRYILALLALIPLPCYAQFGGYSSDLPFMGVDSAGSSSNPEFDLNTIDSLMFWHDANQVSGPYNGNTNAGAAKLQGYTTGASGITNGEPLHYSQSRNTNRAKTTASPDTWFHDLVSGGLGTVTDHRWYATNGPNGKPAFWHTNTVSNPLDTLGYSDLNSGSGGAVNTNQPNYVFLIARITATPCVPVSRGTFANAQLFSSTTHAANNGYYNYTFSPNPTNWMILTVAWNGANSFIRTNGVLFASGSVANDNEFARFKGYHLFTYYGGSSYDLDVVGGWSAYAAYGNRVLSTNEIMSIENGLSNQWLYASP